MARLPFATGTLVLVLAAVALLTAARSPEPGASPLTRGARTLAHAASQAGLADTWPLRELRAAYSRPQCGPGLKQIQVALHAAAPAAAVDVDDLRRGLVLTSRDSAGRELAALEPSIALALNAGEALHPRLAPEGGTLRWQGYLVILRAGPYRFDATLCGRLHLTVGGKVLLSATVGGSEAKQQEGPETTLEPGVHLLEAEFTRLGGPARVELFWRGPHFRREPLPYDHVGHLPAQEPERLGIDQEAERGRFLVEEHSCVRCHEPAANDRLARGLASRPGPDLTRIGERAFAGWLFEWLRAPHRLRPEAVMPRLFRDDDLGRAEAYAVASYLATLGKQPLTDSNTAEARGTGRAVANGRQLFTSLGCVACHPAPGNKAAPASRSVPLRALGSKTTPEKLAEYLANPLALDPSGRMPHMLLSRDEARDLAIFLCRDTDASLGRTLPPAPDDNQLTAAFHRLETGADALAAWQRLAPAARWQELGRRLVVAKGCTSCHAIAPGGKVVPSQPAAASFTALQQPAALERGCLADEGPQRGPAPVYAWSAADRQAVRRFLREGAQGPGAPAPMHAARSALRRFNCLACHSRQGEGGLSPELVEQLRQFEKAENAEAITPPPLTGVGHKLRASWLRQVLVHGGRARPWMGLRMPQFGEVNVAPLVEGLARLEGTLPDDRAAPVALTSARIEAGRTLVGKSAFGCISCHDIAGIANTGTRGPDLALMTQRVRYDWYRNWLEQPQRMQPGTRMPMVFPDGKSTLPSVLHGDADAQAEALWAYTSLGMGLPLPEGLEPPRGLILTAADRPLVVRTFLPEAGSRGIAVGYPQGVAVAFDAVTCRLAYAWTGSFLDASPVWDGRGGAPAKVLGARFWTAPPGVPWAVAPTPPDFAARARDPAHGGPVPEGTVYQGPRQVQFEGYALDRAGLPTFRYRVDAATPHPLRVHERPQPLRGPAGVGIARHFTLEQPAGQEAWLRAAESSQPPRLLDRARGVAVDLVPRAASSELPAAEQALLVPQADGRVVVLSAAAAPSAARWHVRQAGDRWQVLLHLPGPATAGMVQTVVHVWAPYRDDPGLLKELLLQRTP